MSELKKIFEEGRKSLLRDLDRGMGISSDRIKQLERTIGRGMQKKRARFIPQRSRGPESPCGVLEYEVKEKGKTVTKTKDITDPEETAFLFGLQQEADRKRS